jgi:mRNA interferase RelE/StbE
MEEVVSNPNAGVRLRGKLQGLVRWRVGDYRIIYTIDEAKGLIVFVDVGLRKTIYG